MLKVIDKYMICTMGGGNLDDVGRIISKTPPAGDGCLPDNMNAVGKMFVSLYLSACSLNRSLKYGLLIDTGNFSIAKHYGNHNTFHKNNNYSIRLVHTNLTKRNKTANFFGNTQTPVDKVKSTFSFTLNI